MCKICLIAFLLMTHALQAESDNDSPVPNAGFSETFDFIDSLTAARAELIPADSISLLISDLEIYKHKETPTEDDYVITLDSLETNYIRDVYLHVLNEGLVTFPDSYHLKLRQARHLFYYDLQFDEAEQIFAEILTIRQEKEVLLEYAQLQQKLHNYEKAEQCYLELLETFNNDSSVFGDYYNFLIISDKQSQADKELLDFLSINEGTTFLLKAAGDYYYIKNLPYRAMKYYKKALRKRDIDDVISYMQIIMNKNTLNDFTRSRLYSYYENSFSESEYWKYTVNLFYLTCGKRITDSFFLTLSYMHREIRRKYKSFFIDYSDEKTTELTGGELVYIMGEYFMIEGNVNYSYSIKNIPYKSINLSYKKDDLLDTSLEFSQEMLDLSQKHRKDSFNFSFKSDRNNWIFENNLTLNNCRNDEVIMNNEIKDRANFGFWEQMEIKNQVVDLPEIKTGLYFRYADFQYRSRYYYSPEQLILIGGTFEVKFTPYSWLEAGFEHFFVFDNKADLTWSLKPVLLLKPELFTLKLSIDIYRTSDWKDNSYQLLLSELKLPF